MSKELPSSSSEEVDLGQLFKLIGKAFDKFIKFIISIFKSIFSVIIYAIKAVITNFKILTISIVLAGILGFVAEKFAPDVFESKMLIKPYFDSKYQLVNNINFYKGLIGNGDFEKLASIFKIGEEDASDIIDFEIVSGPETENDRILQYEAFIKSVDSIRAQDISFKEYIEDRSVYSGSVFEISVKSYKKDIFKSLEHGLKSAFINTYSVEKKKKRDSLLIIKKIRILKSLKEVDSLKNVYLDVLKNESSSSNKGTITLKDGMSLVQERVKTREYDLLDKQLELQQALANLESEKVEEDVFFDTISSFQDVGSKYSSIWNKYKIIFPVLTFILLVLGYLIKKTISFVNRYEA